MGKSSEAQTALDHINILLDESREYMNKQECDACYYVKHIKYKILPKSFKK